MTKELHGLCQSGERVHLAGTYQVVGVHPIEQQNKPDKICCTLHVDEFFPDYEGRAVCWYLIEPIVEQRDSKQPFTMP